MQSIIAALVKEIDSMSRPDYNALIKVLALVERNGIESLLKRDEATLEKLYSKYC